MSDSMIEKVAKAIWESQHGPWEMASEAGKRSLRVEARAAIKAMREPTDEMIHAGNNAMVYIDCTALNVWRAMHDRLTNPDQEADAALDEKE